MALLGVVSRPTRDCDILHPDIPPEVKEAARAFAIELQSSGEDLDEDWLNNGPSSLADSLPPGWSQRLRLGHV